jgi:hypothetical protein
VCSRAQPAGSRRPSARIKSVAGAKSEWIGGLSAWPKSCRNTENACSQADECRKISEKLTASPTFAALV